MGIYTYIEVPDNVLDVNDPIRSVDAKQLNTNIKSLQERVLALNDPSFLFDHFASDHGYASGLIIDGPTDGAGNTGPTKLDPNGNISLGDETGRPPYANPRIILYASANATWAESISGSTTDQHYLTCTDVGALRITDAIYFNNRSSPVIFTARIKLATNPSNSAHMFFGIMDGTPTHSARPTNGVFMEYSAGDWRFTTGNAGAYTSGAVFTPITATNWFELEIRFLDDSGGHAECYIDGNLEADLSGANLPFAKQVFPTLSWNTTPTWNVDYVSLSSAGIDDAA